MRLNCTYKISSDGKFYVFLFFSQWKRQWTFSHKIWPHEKSKWKIWHCAGQKWSEQVIVWKMKEKITWNQEKNPGKGASCARFSCQGNWLGNTGSVHQLSLLSVALHLSLSLVSSYQPILAFSFWSLEELLPSKDKMFLPHHTQCHGHVSRSFATSPVFPWHLDPPSYSSILDATNTQHQLSLTFLFSIFVHLYLPLAIINLIWLPEPDHGDLCPGQQCPSSPDPAMTPPSYQSYQVHSAQLMMPLS